MIQYHQMAAYFDFLYFEVGNRRGKYRFSIDLFANISDMLLNTLTVDPLVFYLGKIYLVAPFYFSNKAHCVYILHYDRILQHNFLNCDKNTDHRKSLYFKGFYDRRMPRFKTQRYPSVHFSGRSQVYI